MDFPFKGFWRGKVLLSFQRLLYFPASPGLSLGAIRKVMEVRRGSIRETAEK